MSIFNEMGPLDQALLKLIAGRVEVALRSAVGDMYKVLEKAEGWTEAQSDRVVLPALLAMVVYRFSLAAIHDAYNFDPTPKALAALVRDAPWEQMFADCLAIERCQASKGESA